MAASESTSDSSGANTSWLVREGRVLASLEVPVGRKGKTRGLLGRQGIEGAMLIRPARSIHTIGMKFDLDVALLDLDFVVIKTLRMSSFRVSAPMWRARSVIEAEAGAFHRWDLKIGDELEVRNS